MTESSKHPIVGGGGTSTSSQEMERLRKENEQLRVALRESEQKYREVVELANDGICIVRNNRFVYVNESLVERLGYKKHEMIGHPFAHHIAPEDRLLMGELFRRHMSGEREMGLYETSLLTKSGERFPVEINGSIITYNGEPAEMVQLREISERKKMEATLQAEREFLHNIIHLNPYAICIFNTDGRFVTANQAYCDMMGGTPPPDYSLMEDPYAVEYGQIEKLLAMARGEHDRIEIDLHYNPAQIRPADPAHYPDRPHHLHIVLFPVNDATGKVVSIASIAQDVTEEKLALERLRMSEENYRLLAETAQDIIAVISLQGKILYMNPTGYNRIEWTEEELRSLTVLDLVTNIDEVLERGRQRRAGDRSILRYESEVHSKSGKIIPIEISTTPIIKDDKIDSLLVIGRDITEHKKAQLALERERAAQDRLIELNPYAIALLDANGYYVKCNTAFRNLFGGKPPAGWSLDKDVFIIKQGYADAVHDLMLGKVDRVELQDWHNPNRAAEAFGGKNYPDVDLYLQTAIFNIRNRDGKVEHLVMMIQDITQQKADEFALVEAKSRLEARVHERTTDLETANLQLRKEIAERRKIESALRASEDRFRMLFETAPDAIFTLDEKGHIDTCNRTFLELSGLSKDQVLGKTPLDTIFDLSELNVDRLVDQFKASQQTEAEAAIATADNRRIPIWGKATALHADGKLNGAIIHARDITKRKALESDLQTHVREIALYNDILTHDINNINQTTLTYLNMMLGPDFGQVNADQASFLRTCRSQIDRCTGLINKIRTLATLRKESKTDFVVMELDAALMKALGILHAANKDRKLKVDFKPQSGRKVLADRLIIELFYNLLENTIKHCAREEVQIWLGIEEVKVDDLPCWMAYVEDRGPGVRDDRKPVIFDRFESTKRHKGSGLGLAIVKALAERYRGSVRVEDRVPGDYTQGSRFLVTLPKAKSDDD